MLALENGADWFAQAKIKSEFTASFHINGIYSTFILGSKWPKEYEESRDDPDRAKHTYLKRGIPLKTRDQGPHQ